MKSAYLDIETDYRGPYQDQKLFSDYANHEITVVGIRLLGEGTDSFVQLVGEQVTRENLLTALEGVGRLVTYNGRSVPDRVKRSVGFDFPVIAARLGITLDEEFKHLDLCPLCWKKNLYGGLKKVEQTLGLRRKLPGKDGIWATETWRKYKETGDVRSLEQLLAYNREDVFMLAEVERALETRL